MDGEDAAQTLREEDSVGVHLRGPIVLHEDGVSDDLLPDGQEDRQVQGGAELASLLALQVAVHNARGQIASDLDHLVAVDGVGLAGEEAHALLVLHRQQLGLVAKGQHERKAVEFATSSCHPRQRCGGARGQRGCGGARDQRRRRGLVRMAAVRRLVCMAAVRRMGAGGVGRAGDAGGVGRACGVRGVGRARHARDDAILVMLDGHLLLSQLLQPADVCDSGQATRRAPCEGPAVCVGLAFRPARTGALDVFDAIFGDRLAGPVVHVLLRVCAVWGRPWGRAGRGPPPRGRGRRGAGGLLCLCCPPPRGRGCRGSGAGAAGSGWDPCHLLPDVRAADSRGRRASAEEDKLRLLGLVRAARVA
mmetsp:Transcript_80579/g.207391  ORF Transcript_80579/g.207391 Transcript_80579/m.207391 type:complete len:362 (+) Transcript_80579:611-1696(+)